MRRKNLTRFTLFLTMLILFSVLATGAESTHKVFPGALGGTLTLDMSYGGSVRIVGWDQEIISVTYEDTRIGLDVWMMSFDASNDGLRIVTTLSDPQLDSGGLQFTIKVPSEFDLNINSAGGNVTIEGVEGTFTAHTAGGLTFLTNVSGEAHLTTGGGNIKVTNSELTGSATTGGGDIYINLDSGWMDVQTGAGDVTVEIEQMDVVPKESTFLRSGLGDVTLTVPDDYPMNLAIDLTYTQLATRAYKISSDFEIEQNLTPEWDFSHSEANPVKHIYGRGRVNGGGHALQIRTTNGNVRVKKR